MAREATPASAAGDDSETAASADYPRLYAAALLVIFLVVVWRGVGRHQFVYDDLALVVQNEYLVPLTWSNVAHFWDWRTPYANMYTPVTFSVLAIEAHLALKPIDGDEAQLQAGVFHYGNLAVHIACTLVIFMVLCDLAGRTLPAFVGTMLFGLHPVQAEAVNWIIELKGLLAGLFVALTIWCYWRFARSAHAEPNGVGAQPQPAPMRALWYIAATGVALLAMLSKPSGVAVIAIVFVLDFGLLRRSPLATIVPLMPWVAAGVAIALVTQSEQPTSAIRSIVPLWQRPLVAGDAVAFYIRKLLVPWPLCVDYGLRPTVVMARWSALIMWILPALVAAVLAMLPNRRRWLTAYGVFVAGLLPMLGFVPFGFQNVSTVADRYMYLAMLGPAMAVAWLLVGRENTRALAVAALVLIVCGVMSSLQSRYWASQSTLFQHAIDVNPNSVEGHVSLGNLLARNDPDAAIRHYEQALAADPEHPGAHSNLGSLLVAVGRTDDALVHLRAALDANDKNYLAHYYLARALNIEGEYATAANHYAACVESNPGWTSARVDLAWLLATCPDDSVRDATAALEMLDDLPAATMIDPVRQEARAAALVELGQFHQANDIAYKLAAEMQALVRRDGRWTAYFQAFMQRVSLYQDGQAYHGGPLFPLVPTTRTPQ